MKDVDPLDDMLPSMKRHSWNHGIQMFPSTQPGQSIREDFGLDRSTMSGDSNMERGPYNNVNGGVDYLGHSVKGAKAVQGKEKNGTKSELSEF